MSEVTELLAQIAEHTKTDNRVIWIAAISSASTLIAAGIGAVLLYRGTAKQVEATNIIEEKKLLANIITTERLRWLQELRLKSSEFYANLDMNYSLLKRPINPQDNPEYQEQSDKIAEKVMIQCNQIGSLLNPRKQHQKLMRKLCNNALSIFQEAVSERNSGDFMFDDEKYSTNKTNFFNSLTEIGIKTWAQIKELK